LPLRIISQLLILAYALYNDWSPYQLLFLYIYELFLLGCWGVLHSIRFGGLKYIPSSIFCFLLVSGIFSLGLLFGISNVIKPFGITPDSLSGFYDVLFLSFSEGWGTVLFTTFQISFNESRVTHVKNFDPFFYPLRPLKRIIPFFVIFPAAGFLSLLFGPKLILIGMTVCDLSTDLILEKIKSTKA
jgi:hypothetical protein